jgi:Ca2+-transporting ATPase
LVSGNGSGASPSSGEIESRARKYGLNELAEPPRQRWWLKLLNQFNEVVVWILITATILSAALGDWLEAGAIFAIIILNALLGFFQEQKADKALAALKKLSSPWPGRFVTARCEASRRQLWFLAT